MILVFADIEEGKGIRNKKWEADEVFNFWAEGSQDCIS